MNEINGIKEKNILHRTTTNYFPVLMFAYNYLSDFIWFNYSTDNEKMMCIFAILIFLYCQMILYSTEK